MTTVEPRGLATSAIDTKEEPRVSEYNRRSILAFFGAAAGAAIIGSVVGGTITGPGSARAFAAGTTSADEAIAVAMAMQNKTLNQIESASNWGPDLVSPWAGYQGDWCAWFVTWILRDTDSFNSDDFWVPTLLSKFQNNNRLRTTPERGALVFYMSSSGPYHVGLVTSSGSSPSTIEGNSGLAEGHGTDWSNDVAYAHPSVWSGNVMYGYPNYGSGSTPVPPPPTTSNIEETDVMYIRRAATGDIAVFGPDYKNASGSSGRHQFATSDEYNTWRSVLVSYNAQIDAQGLDTRGKYFVPPANLSDVMGVDEVGWTVICGMYNV